MTLNQGNYILFCTIIFVKCQVKSIIVRVILWAEVKNMGLTKKQKIAVPILILTIIGILVLIIYRLVPVGTFFVLALIFLAIDIVNRKRKKRKQ
ncbi:hypothetical protein ACFLVQ_01450 [Chloroflexota bacterium]